MAKSPQMPPRREQADDETIARLRTITAESANHLILGDGPVSPDAALLDDCAEALHLLLSAERALETRRRCQVPYLEATQAQRREDNRLFEEAQALKQRAKGIMRRIAKKPATTPACIYAKALIVRGSRTGAECLARSLAKDLVECTELRQSLWPAGGAS